MNVSPNLINLVKGIAAQHGLDPDLVCAVVEQESAWNEWEFRYEPAFYATYIAPMLKGASPAGPIKVFDPSCSIETEAAARAFSWGLMQILGQVAREQGFDEPDLRAGLLNPLNAVTQGCRKLKKCLSLETHEHGTYAEDVNAGLLRYNGGGDANYPALVMSHYGDYAYLNVSAAPEFSPGEMA